MQQALIIEIGPDTFQVSNFLLSASHVRAKVRFDGEKPRVFDRENYDGAADADWDRIAVDTVRAAILKGSVQWQTS